MFGCLPNFVFSIGILGQVWYLIVSIPDLCTFTYFVIASGEDCDQYALVNRLVSVLATCRAICSKSQKLTVLRAVRHFGFFGIL